MKDKQTAERSLYLQRLKIGELIRLWEVIHKKEKNLRHPSFKVLRDEITMRLVNIFLFFPIGGVSAYMEVTNFADCMPVSCKSAVIRHFFKRMKLVEDRLNDDVPSARRLTLQMLKKKFKEFLE